MPRFSEKVAIVTGAASGIGEATARRLAAEGAFVVLADVDADGLKRVAGAIGEKALACRTDVSDMEVCEALVAVALKRFGQLDILVSNAGVDHLGRIDEGPLSDFTRAFAMEEAKVGVRVNAVNPSPTYTPFTQGMKDQPDLVAKFEKRIPMGRGAEVEDITGAIAFLASEDAHYITGVNLPVDGGLSASNGQPALS